MCKYHTAHGERYVMFTSNQLFTLFSFFLLGGTPGRLGATDGLLYPGYPEWKVAMLLYVLGHVDGEFSVLFGLKDTRYCCKAVCYSYYTIQVPVQKKVWW